MPTTEINMQPTAMMGKPNAPTPQKSAGAKPVEGPQQTVQTEKPAEKQAQSQEELQKVVQDFAEKVQSLQRNLNLNFSIDSDSGRTVVKVIDTSSDEVIRQIPSEEMLALARYLSEHSDTGEQLSGLFMQSTA